MRLLPSRPGLLQFTQVLPLLDPDNDPSLKTRGAFPAKVPKQPCVGSCRDPRHRSASCAARHAAPRCCHLLRLSTGCSFSTG